MRIKVVHHEGPGRIYERWCTRKTSKTNENGGLSEPLKWWDCTRILINVFAMILHLSLLRSSRSSVLFVFNSKWGLLGIAPYFHQLFSIYNCLSCIRYYSSLNRRGRISFFILFYY